MFLITQLSISRQIDQKILENIHGKKTDFFLKFMTKSLQSQVFMFSLKEKNSFKLYVFLVLEWLNIIVILFPETWICSKNYGWHYYGGQGYHNPAPVLIGLRYITL